MSEVLQANIFFIIASVGVIVFTILVSICLFYVIKILRSVQQIIERIEVGTDSVMKDVTHLREYLAEKSFISRIIGMFVSQRVRRNRDTEDEDE